MVEEIISLVDKTDGKVIKRKPRYPLMSQSCLMNLSHVPSGSAAVIIIQLLNRRGIAIEPFHVNRAMGRVVLRNEGQTVGAGSLAAVFLTTADVSLL